MSLLVTHMASQSLGMCSLLTVHMIINLSLSNSVSSAVIQRYLQQVLDAALSANSQIQSSAVEILSYTIKQGLAHPLLVSKS